MAPSTEVRGERRAALLSMVRRRPVAALLLMALGVREVFSFWTGHPYDFEVWIRTAHAVASGENPYAFWPAVPGVSIAYPNLSLPSAAYLPFWPLLTGGLYRVWEVVGGGNRFALYFLLKQPPIWGDVATAYLLYRLAGRWTGQERRARWVLAFWAGFPYAIAITAVWGQFDSLVVPLVLGALWVQSGLARNLLHGWGIFVKWVTAVFLPLELCAARGLRRLEFLLAPLLALGATLATFAIMGWGFTNVVRASVSQTHGGGGGMSWVGVLTSAPLNATTSSIPYLEVALGYLWIPAVCIAGFFAAPWLRTGRPDQVLRAFACVVLAFLLFRWGLYEQYLLYLFPLLLLDVVLFHPVRRDLFAGTMVLGSSYLLVNNDFGLRFVAPIVPGVTPYTAAIDASGGYGLIRVYLLIVLGVVMTATLVQLLSVYGREAGASRPWWAPLGRFLPGRSWAG